MRTIHVDDIVATLRQLCIDANIEIRPDTVEAYHRALEQEESETGREVLQQLILNAEVVAFEDLGPEAIYRLTVSGFPAMVVNDLHGGDLYEEGRNQYRRLRAG